MSIEIEDDKVLANIRRAKKIIRESDVIVIFTGAGMSAQSGLDTFKSTTNSRNKIKQKGVTYAELTTPKAFELKNTLAWTFHGNRLNSYQKAKPHSGYQTLLDLAKSKKDHFVVTSNIDSAHHKASFENVYEIHGRLNKFQCLKCEKLWKAAEDLFFDIDLKSYTLKNGPPTCVCGGKVRPNVMLFGHDHRFNKKETKEQSSQFNIFMRKYDQGDHKIALIEIGAGESVRSIRNMSEYIHENVKGATLIRINPTDIKLPDKRAIIIQMNALEAINALVSDE